MKELYLITVNLDIYEDFINVIWGNRKKAMEFTGYKAGKTTDGWADKRKDGSIYCYIGEKKSRYTTSIHELIHAIMFLTEKRGILIDDSDSGQEASAYLFAYVIDQALSTPKKDWFIWKGKGEFDLNFKKQHGKNQRSKK